MANIYMVVIIMLGVFILVFGVYRLVKYVSNRSLMMKICTADALIDIYMKKGELDKAIKEWGKLIKCGPKEALSYYGRGSLWAKIGEFGKAIEDYNKAIELDPEDNRFYNNRGHAWYKKGELDKAIADFNKALELDPKYAAAYNNRGAAWADKGDFDKAIAGYDKAIELNPKYAGFYLNAVGMLITLKQDFHGAAERLKQGQSRNAFESNEYRLVVSCLEGIALALNGEDASAAEAEATRLLAGGAKVGDWDTKPMDCFLKDLKAEDFAPGALETARRIQEMLKN